MERSVRGFGGFFAAGFLAEFQAFHCAVLTSSIGRLR